MFKYCNLNGFYRGKNTKISPYFNALKYPFYFSRVLKEFLLIHYSEKWYLPNILRKSLDKVKNPTTSF